MSDEYFLDYEGMHTAKTQFSQRSRDLAGAGAQTFPVGDTEQFVAGAAHNLLEACSGRLFAYGDELSVLAAYVEDVVTVTNQVDVDLTAAP